MVKGTRCGYKPPVIQNREENTMKINLENLFYTVQEHLNNVSEYHKVRLECWEKQSGGLRKIGCTPKNHPLYVDNLQGNDALNFTRHYERVNSSERAISDFCDILGIDQNKLYSIVKGIKKWHEKRDWQICFPFTDRNNSTILSYIQAQ
jgi:hypothetical protein